MKKLGQNCRVFCAGGVKVMYNPKHKETIYVLPKAMWGKSLDAWKVLHAAELHKLINK